MKLNVLFSPHNVDELYFTGKTTVVIDVLRASSTITAALSNGAKEVIPVGSIEFAMKVSGNAFGGQTLLGGERNTKMIEGFNLGNSPLEYTTDSIFGKSIILFTTNGSKSVVKAKFSANLYVACFNNLSAIVKHLLITGDDVEILCAGTGGMFCLEDTICAGYLIKEITSYKSDIQITDAARASVVLADTIGSDIYTMLTECEHGKLLTKNGYEADLSYCSVLNSTDVIGKFNTGVIKKIII